MSNSSVFDGAGGFSASFLISLAHGADHQEQHEGDDDEVKREGDEIPPSQYGALLFRLDQGRGGDLGRQRQEIVGKIDAAGDRADHRHDDVADQRIDDGAEGGPDDHADGEIDHIAAQGEFLEILEHRPPPARDLVDQPGMHHGLAHRRLVFSETGTMGSRTVSAHLPISDSAYLTGAGLVSTEQIDVQRHRACPAA